MKPKSTLRCFLALVGSSLLAISYSHGQTNLAHSYLTSLDVSSPTTLVQAPFYNQAGQFSYFNSILVGPLTGSSTLTYSGRFFGGTTSGQGQLSLVGNTGNTFNGNIIVNSGALRIAGSPFASNGGFVAGSMDSGDTITINRAGTLLIDDTVTGGYTANRFGTGASSNRPAVNLAGGFISLSGLNNASSSVQTFGDLTASSGQASLNVTRNSNGNPTLTFDSLAINSGSILSFNGTNLGTGTSDARITFTTAPTLTNGIIAGAWNNGGAGSNNFVTDGANGVRVFTALDYTDVGSDITTATPTQNAHITAGTAAIPVGWSALSGALTVNSLKIGGAVSGAAWAMGNKLTITSGMLLRDTSQNAPVNISTGTLTAGNGTDDIDLHVMVGQNNMTINALIEDNSATAVTLVKSGDARSLTLSGSVDNTYTGGTSVVGGDLITGNTANRRYLGTGKVTVNGGASSLQLSAAGATSFSGSLVNPTYTATNGGRIQVSNNNHSGGFFNISADSIINGASGSGTGLASLTRNTNITLASGAIIGHGTQSGALSLTTGTIQNLGTSADLFYGLTANQNNASGQITIGNGTAFRGISTDDNGDRNWEQGTINIATGTTSVEFQSHSSNPDARHLTLGNALTAGAPVIVLADVGTLDIKTIGRVQLNDTAGTYGDTGTGRNVRFVVSHGSQFTVELANGMGTGTGIASALVQNGARFQFNASDALNGAVTVESGGVFYPRGTVTSLTGTGALTFNEGSIVDIINSASFFSGTQASAATINPGTIFRLGVANFVGTAGATLDSLLGSGSKHVSYLHTNNNAPNPSVAGTPVYTLNKSGGGIGGVLTNEAQGAYSVSALANGNITLGANGGVIAATTNSTFTIAENITGAGSLTIGTSAIINGMPKLGTVALNSANDYTGGTTVSAGTLQLGNATALGSTSASLTINASATLNMNNQSPTVGNLTGTGGVINSGNSGGRTLTIGQGDTGGGNFQGIYTLGTGGSANLTKVGTGTITLSGANTYNGNTAINGGTLLINGDQTAAAGNVTVAAAATLGGTGTIGGNTTIADTGKLQFNLSTPAGSHDRLEIATGKALTFSGASTLTITSSGGASPGLYTLVSGGNNIGGIVPATVVLPVGWTADAPVIVGNELRINITFTGGGGDVTAPMLSGITDNVGGGPVTEDASVTYTVTFNEDIDSATVSIADFDNQGTAALTINSVAETGPSTGVFTVVATPTSPGTLRLRIPTGAVITDTSGNPLVVPVSDDTTITVRSKYEAWSGALDFDADTNGDGIKNGLAFLLGAADKNVSALGLLPTVTQSGGNLILTFQMLNQANRKSASIQVQQSRDLGIADAWADSAVVPEVNGGPSPSVNGVTFNVTLGSPKNTVVATVAASEAGGTGKLFGRVKGNQ
jgi:fibronectin-binding autotransporter adhesin